MNKGNNKGFTLIEILVVLVLSVIAIVALLYSLTSTFPLIELARERTIATSHLRNMMEEIRSTPFANVTGLFPDGFVDSSAIARYIGIISNYDLINEQITVDYVNPNADPLQISVDLDWQDRRGRNFNASVSTFKTR